MCMFVKRLCKNNKKLSTLIWQFLRSPIHRRTKYSHFQSVDFSDNCFLNFPLQEGQRAHERLFDASNVERELSELVNDSFIIRLPIGADWIRWFFGKLMATRFKKLEKTCTIFFLSIQIRQYFASFNKNKIYFGRDLDQKFSTRFLSIICVRRCSNRWFSCSISLALSRSFCNFFNFIKTWGRDGADWKSMADFAFST